MNLPSSRNTTYGPGSQILSADLNAIQDCIIGYKHGPIHIDMVGAQFQLVQGSGAGGLQGNGSQLGVGLFVSGLWLPVGSRLVSIEWFYNRHSAGTLQGSVTDVNFPPPSSSLLNDVFTDSTNGSTDQSSGVRSISFTPADKVAVLLSWSHTNAANSFNGCQVIIDRT